VVAVTPTLSSKFLVITTLAAEFSISRFLMSRSLKSLCNSCGNHRSIISGKGSRFLLCKIGLTTSLWPKYPPQPMTQCAHFQNLPESDQNLPANQLTEPSGDE
jgi:hypothetical protein